MGESSYAGPVPSAVTPNWHLSGSLILSSASLPPHDSQPPSPGSTSFLSSPNFSPCCLLQRHTLPASQTPQQERWAHSTPTFCNLAPSCPQPCHSHQFCHFHCLPVSGVRFLSCTLLSIAWARSLPWAIVVPSVLVSAAALYPPLPLPPSLNS